MKIVAVLFSAGDLAKSPGFQANTENALGLREFLQGKGHELIVTSDKEGSDCELEKHIPDMDIIITTPFHPAYMTRERLDRAKKLRLIITAGIGSDHIDLHAAAEKNMTVAEITGSNVTSVAEDEVMRILILLRNFTKGYEQVIHGGWNVAEIAQDAHDLEGKTVGTWGAGRIGQHVLKRLQGFDVKRVYYARHDKGDEFGTWIEDEEEFLRMCDVIVLNTPLTDATKGMVNKDSLSKMKKGVYIVNNGRGALCDVDAIVEAMKGGHLAGYGGDVWDVQPAPQDHPWRSLPKHAMTPHTSGTTLEAQERYAQGAKMLLDAWFNNKPFPEEDYIVREGELASQYQ